MLDEDQKDDQDQKGDDPSQIARWGTDETRREFRRGLEAQLTTQMTMRRRAAEQLTAGTVEMSRDAGFVSCSGDYPDVSGVVPIARRLRDARNLEKLKLRANKPFMMRMLQKRSFGLDSPLMRLALDPDIVATVSRYLGLVPILQFINVYYSCATTEDLSKSQLYHCDSDDVEQVKVWVLCEDVTPDSGPLTLLPPAESELVRRRSGYRFDTLLQDEQVYGILGGRDKEQQFIGPTGTVGFIDTSRCLHFGSRFVDPTKTRLIFMAHYVTPLSFILPPQYWEHARYREFAASSELDDVSRLVLGVI